MSIRSALLAIAGAALFTAAQGGIAKADDQMPASGAAPSVEKVTGGGSEGAANAGQGGSGQFSGRMTSGQEERAGQPIDPRAEERAGRNDPQRPDPTGGTPSSKGY